MHKHAVPIQISIALHVLNLPFSAQVKQEETFLKYMDLSQRLAILETLEKSESGY